jgi:site-specific DNA-methyltransferase (adenine-specific)
MLKIVNEKDVDLSFETRNGMLINCNCLDRIGQFGEKYDLVITSPPYNVGIPYDTHNDCMDAEDYVIFLRRVFSKIFNSLNTNGRMAVNVLYEAKMKDAGRIFFAAEIWKLLKSIGFQWAGIVDLEEISPHRPKLTAWGSWLSQSAPYIYNPKECVIICYKDEWKRKGEKLDITKDEFIELVSGIWKYRPQTQKLTEANYSLDIPLKALKILGMKGDYVLDPFMGSGTTAIACEELGFRWKGFEISKNYYNIAKSRIKNYVNRKDLL